MLYRRFFANIFDRYDIKETLGYGRKSRGDKKEKDDLDGIKDLERQRRKLHEVSKHLKFNMKYYEEIGSAESVNDRVQLPMLLEEIKANPRKYDAILVNDIDRLSRNYDIGIVIDVCKKHNIKIMSLACNHIYDMSNKDDMESLSVKHFVAQLEWNKVTGRLAEGREDSFEAGNWVNSDPPFPYVYNKKTHGLDIMGKDENDQKQYLTLYQQALDLFLKGFSYDAIGDFLSLDNDVKTYRGNDFRGKTVKNLITSYIHLGKNIKRGFKDKLTKRYVELPKDEWTTIHEVKWEQIKSLETQKAIHKELIRRSQLSKKSKNSIHALSSLLTCGICGRPLTVTLNPKGELITRACEDKTKRIKCGNKGGKIGFIENYIQEILNEYLENVEDANDIDVKSSYQMSIDKKKKKIEQLILEKEDAQELVEGIQDNLDRGKKVYNTDEKLEKALERQSLHEARIEEINETIGIFEDEIAGFEEKMSNSIKETLDEVLKKLREEKNAEKRNTHYKRLIREVIWYRPTDEKIKITISQYEY